MHMPISSHSLKEDLIKVTLSQLIGEIYGGDFDAFSL